MDYWSLTAEKNTVEDEGSIRDWVNHAQLPVDAIIEDAQNIIMRDLRVIEMRTLQTGTLAEGESEIDISDWRFLQPLSFRFVGTRTQAVTHRLQEIFEMSLTFDDSDPPQLNEGTPTDYMHDRSKIYLNYQADEDLTYRIWHYQKPEALSDDNPTNLLTTDYPHIMRQACIAMAYDYRKDAAKRDAALQLLSVFVERALVDTDMAAATAEYNMYAYDTDARGWDW